MHKKTNNSSTLLVNVCRLQPVDYESIIQSLITNTDYLWLQSMAMDVNDKSTVYKIEQLIEVGLISLWDYEKRLGKGTAKLNRVITLEEYKEADQYTTQLVSEMTYQNTRMLSSDYTTWNIEKRNTFSNLIIANYCGASSLLQRSAPSLVSLHIAGQEGSDLLQLYSKYLFGKISIQTLSNLTIEQILELRQLSAFFRNEIKIKINSHLLSNEIPLVQIEQDCNELYMKLSEMVDAAIMDKYSTQKIGESLSLDILSCFIEPLSYFLKGQKIYDLIFKRKQRGFVVYLSKLKKFTQ